MLRIPFYFLILALISGPLLSKSIVFKAQNSERRSAKLFLPKGFKKRDQWPLIISLHGYRGSSQLQRVHLRMTRLKNKYGFMILYPNGLKDAKGMGYWNASNYCCDFGNTKVDDVQYIKNLVNELERHPKVGRLNRNKIFVVGFSNGAFMAHKLACQASDLVSGIVTFSGTSDLRDDQGNLLPRNKLNCQHKKPIKALHIHGTDDEVITFNEHDNGKAGQVGALAHIQKWANHNICNSKFEFNERFNSLPSIKGKETEHYKYNDCLAPVEFYKIIKGRHFNVHNRKFIERVVQFLFPPKK